MRASGLICLGAGAGLIRSDLRQVRGSDIVRRSGGVVVSAGGHRPRVVPVLARYHQPLLASAAFAGNGLVTGGHDPDRRNLATPLLRALDGGTGLPRLDTSRLRATWLGDCAQLLGPGHVHARRRDHLLPAARRHHRHPRSGRGGRGGATARWCAVNSPVTLALEEITGGSGVAPRIEALLPIGVRPRQLRVRTLLTGHEAGPGRSPARAPDPGTRGADRPARPMTRPGSACSPTWTHGPHLLTYRQTERTFGLAAKALAKDVARRRPLRRSGRDLR